MVFNDITEVTLQQLINQLDLVTDYGEVKPTLYRIKVVADTQILSSGNYII